MQHLHLAENLRNDVYGPVSFLLWNALFYIFYDNQITELRAQLHKKEVALSSQYNSMNQEIKKLENVYTRRFSAYEKSYRDAFEAYTQFKESLLAQQSTSTSVSTKSPAEVYQIINMQFISILIKILGIYMWWYVFCRLTLLRVIASLPPRQNSQPLVEVGVV